MPIDNKSLVDHFGSCNWNFPLLLGSQHNNRFKRNTKVYVLSGIHQGKHGIVVGHGNGFDLKAGGTGSKSPLLKLLLVNQLSGECKHNNVHQDLVKLVDLHNQIDYAVPACGPSGQYNAFA